MEFGGEFDPRMALVGGVLVGLGLFLVLLVNRRPTGVSGIVGALMAPEPGDSSWRLAFLAGLFAGGLVLQAGRPGALVFDIDRSLPALVIAGGLVGYGTRMANGCTSGHGVCGVGRLSPRSLAATFTFLLTGAVTVFVINQAFAGRL